MQMSSVRFASSWCACCSPKPWYIDRCSSSWRRTISMHGMSRLATSGPTWIDSSLVRGSWRQLAVFSSGS